MLQHKLVGVMELLDSEVGVQEISDLLLVVLRLLPASFARKRSWSCKNAFAMGCVIHSALTEHVQSTGEIVREGGEA